MKVLIKQLLPLLRSTKKELRPAPPRKALTAGPPHGELTPGSKPTGGGAGTTTGTAAAGAVRVTKPGDPGTPMAHIPPDARELPWRPTPDIDHGVKYVWTDSAGRKHRFQAHSKQRGRPESRNTSQGPTYREQIGKSYVTADGRLYHKNVHNESSPYFDAPGANDTHDPWPRDVPLPWKADP